VSNWRPDSCSLKLVRRMSMKNPAGSEPSRLPGDDLLAVLDTGPGEHLPGGRQVELVLEQLGEAEHDQRVDQRQQVVDLQAQAVGQVGQVGAAAVPAQHDLGQAGQPVDGGPRQRGVADRAPAPAAVAGRLGRGCRVPLGHHPVDLVHQLVELRGPAAARPGQRVAHVGADPAGVGAQHQDAVGEQDGFLDVVRHHHEGLGREALALPQLQQLTAQVLRGQHVQGAERLVHQQGRGLDHQRPGEADALAHAARQLLGVGGLVTVQADDVDGPQRALGPLGGGHPAGLQAQLHVLLHGEPRQQREGLEDHRGLPVAAGQPLAAEQHPALGGRDQPGDAAQQGGLAAAAAAEQGHELTLGHVEVDVVEHLDGPPGRAGERLAQRPHADQRLAISASGPRHGLSRRHASANLVSASAYRRRHSSTFRPVT
jgi:hypothetical protein